MTRCYARFCGGEWHLSEHGLGAEDILEAHVDAAAVAPDHLQSIPVEFIALLISAAASLSHLTRFPFSLSGIN